ncbi:hypothetical protein [Sphingomonas sp. NFX23]|uniref:hypothetical protein n=1 Tax=Sphingomonas sp. NFX23 TaxID=2819532 RepID=UPI003CE8E35D
MAIDDQLAALLAQNAALFATYEEWSNGQTMLLAGTVDDPASFNSVGGKTGDLGYYPVVNASGQTIYAPCMARLRRIALDGVTDALESSVVSGEGLLHAQGAIGELLRLNVPASTLDDARAGTRNDVALTPQSGKAAVDQGVGGLSALTGFALDRRIRIDAPQTFTDSERSVARGNIGAPAAADLLPIDRRGRRAIDFLTVKKTNITLDIVRYDMTSLKASGGVASEGVPNGAIKDHATGEYQDWALNPLNVYGTNPPANYTAGIPWLQGFFNRDRPWNDRNTRIHVRNLQLWVKLASTQTWENLVIETDPTGAGYVEDFSSNAGIALDQRFEPDGGVSVRMVQGYSFHAYTRERRLIPVGDIAAVYSSFEARLILDDPDGPDDRDQANYVASGGADYWLNLTAGNDQPLANNNAAMMGRMKIVTNDWRPFTSCTLTPAQMTSETVLPPLQPNPVSVLASIQRRALSRSDVYNALDRTTTGGVLDARAGKVLGDATKAVADRVSVVEAVTGGAASRSYYDGVPTVEAAISGKTFFIDASAPIAFPLPATTTGGMRFSVVQMNAAGPIVFAPRAGAVVLGGKTQTGGLFSKYDVLLYRNENGTTAEWLITGSQPLVAAETTPAQPWTPYNYGADRTDLWVDGASAQTITAVDGKASRVIDKASKGRTFYQTNATYRPAIGNPINGKQGLTSTISAPAFMAGVAGTGLTTLTDLFFNGGAFLIATATLGETYSNVPYNAAKIVIWRFSPTGGDIWVNGVRQGGFPDSRIYGFTGMAWAVFNPYSAGQSSLGRVYQATATGPGLLGVAPTSGAPNRSSDMTLYSLGVVNLASITLTGSGDANVELLNGWLADIYGLRSLLPANHPYKTTAPTIA